MEVLKTYVLLDDGTINQVDTIRHDGKLWLVPNWLDTQDGKHSMPARIIRMDTLRHSAFSGSYDFVLQDTMPKQLFERQTPKQPTPGIEVHELPEIYIPRAR